MVEWLGHRILVDCGLLQGGGDLSAENSAPFGFDPSDVDFVLLTHAHLDHCGRLPLLVKRGFRGAIIATAASRELARLVLADSAHLQEEEARRRLSHLSRGQGPVAPALYTLIEAFDVFDRFGEAAEYGRPMQLAPGLRATFFDAGHILGSASVLLEAHAGPGPRSVLFSGDIGSGGQPLLRPASPPARADIVIMESTYGDRLHRPASATMDEFYIAIEEAFARGGNVVIPTFALERAQTILYFLRRGVEQSKIKPTAQVFLDSPMAISATEIFRRHPQCLAPDLARSFLEGEDPLSLPGLHLARETAESIAINKISGGAIIMAGSGMCAGGRIRHHLRHNLARPQSAIIFVGFAGFGTPARQIIDGATEIKLFGEDIPVRAHIHTINGFSAHADQEELVAWRNRIQGDVTFLVHGEEFAMRKLSERLSGRVETPRLHETFDF